MGNRINIQKIIQELNHKEKELLLLLIKKDLPEFTPIEISREIGVTNRTVINRLNKLLKYSFVEPVMVKERIRSYKLTDLTRRNSALIESSIRADSDVDVIITRKRLIKGRAERLLEELILEGFSGNRLLTEFSRRIDSYGFDINAAIMDAKNELIDAGFGEETSYERIPESADKDYKKSVWDAAIGLQAVDGLKPSKYLKTLAEENISGKKTYDDINRELLKEYGSDNSRQKEADIVALRIAELLETADFIMSSNLLLSIHEYLFNGILDEDIVGRFRNYNIRKKEPVLLGDSVRYADQLIIKTQLNQIFNDEKSYEYSNPMTQADIEHLSGFTSKLWQTHPFAEGNTRTTALFIELYLKCMGYEVNNDPFKDHSDYFRNALVRSCNSAYGANTEPTKYFLNRFFMNLLNNSDNVLDDLDLFINNSAE